MANLENYQYVLIALVFVWSGFVRSGLGFGGSVMSLPFLLLIDNRPLVYLPIIAIHLLFFSSITVLQNYWRRPRVAITNNADAVPHSPIAWAYLWQSMKIMIIPKLIGVFGLLTISQHILTGIIFMIVTTYAISYIIDKPFKSNSPLVDKCFLMLGAYISGTSLIGAPLIMAVYSTHVPKHQLRDTLFVLWFILVAIKLTAFLFAGVDLQWRHHLWLLPAAAIGHVIGLRFHQWIVERETKVFYRALGFALLGVSLMGVLSLFFK